MGAANDTANDEVDHAPTEQHTAAALSKLPSSKSSAGAVTPYSAQDKSDPETEKDERSHTETEEDDSVHHSTTARKTVRLNLSSFAAMPNSALWQDSVIQPEDAREEDSSGDEKAALVARMALVEINSPDDGGSDSDSMSKSMSRQASLKQRRSSASASSTAEPVLAKQARRSSYMDRKRSLQSPAPEEEKTVLKKKDLVVTVDGQGHFVGYSDKGNLLIELSASEEKKTYSAHDVWKHCPKERKPKGATDILVAGIPVHYDFLNGHYRLVKELHDGRPQWQHHDDHGDATVCLFYSYDGTWSFALTDDKHSNSYLSYMYSVDRGLQYPTGVQEWSIDLEEDGGWSITNSPYLTMVIPEFTRARSVKCDLSRFAGPAKLKNFSAAAHAVLMQAVVRGWIVRRRMRAAAAAQSHEHMSATSSSSHRVEKHGEDNLETVVMSMKVESVKYDMLVADPALTTAFKDVIRNAVVDMADDYITGESVKIALSPGSVIVGIEIVPPDNDMSCSDLVATFRNAMQALRLRMLVNLTVLPGIRNVSSGAITVSAVEAPVLGKGAHIDDPSSAPLSKVAGLWNIFDSFSNMVCCCHSGRDRSLPLAGTPATVRLANID